MLKAFLGAPGQLVRYIIVFLGLVYRLNVFYYFIAWWIFFIALCFLLFSLWFNRSVFCVLFSVLFRCLFFRTIVLLRIDVIE